MNIVFVIDTYGLQTNGTVMTAFRFVEALKAKGHSVRVVGIGAKGEDCYEVPERYIPLVTEVAHFQHICFGKADIPTLINAFDGADIIHFYLPFKLEKVGRKIADKMGIPYTSAFHLQPENISYNAGMKWNPLVPQLLYWWDRATFYRHFTHIHCPSKMIADQLRKHKYKAKLHVISNGVDPAFVPLEKPKEQGEIINILMIGRYANEKRQDVLIKAVQKSKFRDRIQLILAGQGPNEWILRRKAKNLPHQPIFGFYNKEELIEVIHNADLYVHAADIEIEAIACIEAFSCGVVPVIANSSKSATPQFALDNRSLFKAGDADDLAKKIDYWLEHPQEKAEMANAYIEEGKRFCLDYSITKCEEMFNEAIADFNEAKKLDDKALRKVRKQMQPSRGLFAWFFYYFLAVPLLWIYLKLFFGFRIKGKRNARKVKKTGAVSVSNHVHMIDCTMIAEALFPKKIIFTALPSNFKLPFAGHLVRALGAVPIPIGYNKSRIFMQESKKFLKKKRILHLFPEGHLINYYEGRREFSSGAFRIASDAQVPILPMVITWREPKYIFKYIKKKPCATLTIGEPIFANYVLLRKDMEKDLKLRSEAAIDRMLDQIKKKKIK